METYQGHTPHPPGKVPDIWRTADSATIERLPRKTCPPEQKTPPGLYKVNNESSPEKALKNCLPL